MCFYICKNKKKPALNTGTSGLQKTKVKKKAAAQNQNAVSVTQTANQILAKFKEFLGKRVMVFLQCDDHVGVRLGCLKDCEGDALVLENVVIPKNHHEIVNVFFKSPEVKNDMFREPEKTETKLKPVVYKTFKPKWGVSELNKEKLQKAKEKPEEKYVKKAALKDLIKNAAAEETFTRETVPLQRVYDIIFVEE